MHSSHAKPPEAVVGELERELVKTVGSGKGLTKDQKKKEAQFLSGCCQSSSRPPIEMGRVACGGSGEVAQLVKLWCEQHVKCAWNVLGTVILLLAKISKREVV